MNNEYFEFRNGRRYSGDTFSNIIKLLIVIILFLLIVVLTLFSYNYLTSDKIKSNVIVQQIKTQPKKSPELKKEDIALIVKTIMMAMKAQEASRPLIKAQNKTNDQQLLSSLQSADVDTIANRKVKIKRSETKNISKKIVKKVKKRYVTYNAVIINKKEIRTTSDLAKLYATINKIAKKNKKKILRSAYTKKIRKEIGTRKNSMRTIKVRKGDTLGSLAVRAYGSAKYYRKIFTANPDLVDDPNKISVGQILRVPK